MEENQDAQIQDQNQAVVPNAGQFFVQTLTGSSLAFNYDPNMTISTLKELIQNAQQIQVDQQRLVFNGKQLDDQNTLSDYGIENGSNIHLVLRLRGGF